MRLRMNICIGLPLLCVLAISAAPIRSDSPKVRATSEQGRKTAERGLEFVQRDAAKWRQERQCSTCHHGTMTVWVLSEARSQGYEVAAETLADTVKWTKDRLLERIDQPRDTRPGWSMVNTSAIYLSMLARSVPNQSAVSADDLRRIRAHLLRHQETDGSWAWSSAPPKNRPPPFFESDEVATLLACMALGAQAPNDPKEKAEANDARAKAVEWLGKTTPTDTTQAAALRLLLKVWSGESANALQPEIGQFLSRQNKDGGWGQLKDSPSDAYATGQALYVLSLAGVKNDHAALARGMTFLVDTQQEDGSWPMTSRSHPGAEPFKNPVPITYFGSAWATLGLLRTVPR